MNVLYFKCIERSKCEFVFLFVAGTITGNYYGNRNIHITDK